MDNTLVIMGVNNIVETICATIVTMFLLYGVYKIIQD
jgi:hypothetical protein